MLQGYKAYTLGLVFTGLNNKAFDLSFYTLQYKNGQKRCYY